MKLNKITISVPVKLLIFIPFMLFNFTLLPPDYLHLLGVNTSNEIGFLLLVIMFVFVAGALLFLCMKNTYKVKYWICIIISIIAFFISFVLSGVVFYSETVQNFFKGTGLWFYVFEYDVFNDIMPTDIAFNAFMAICYYLSLVLFWIIVKKNMKMYLKNKTLILALLAAATGSYTGTIP